MPPGVPPSIQHDGAAVEVVVGASSDTTQLAPIRGGIFPPLKTIWSREGVYAGIQHELQGARLQLKHRRLPNYIFFLPGSNSKEVSLTLQCLNMVLQLILDDSSGGASDLCPDAAVELVGHLPCLFPCKHRHLIVHGVEVQCGPVHLFCQSGILLGSSIVSLPC